ncbi:MAG: hypothetical protein IKH50_11080 [Oscillospiraceae bacterium]|nr:hypothetical protein [Oscillospiraceae bacterium]
MKNPDRLNDITAKIKPEEFVTEFNKRVYLAVTDAVRNSSEFSLSLLSDSFSDAEMGRISGMAARNRDITINENTFSDCVDVLKKFDRNSVFAKDSEISDDDLRSLQIHR